MYTQRKTRKSNRFSVLIVLRILFAAGFLLGCLFVRVLQGSITPASNSIWFSGPFEADTDFLSAFSGFLFDLLFYALPIFLFGMTFLGTIIVPLAITAKGFTLGAALTALIQLKGTGVYFRRCLDYLFVSVLGIAVLLHFAAKVFETARHNARTVFGSGDPLSAPISIKAYTVRFLFVFAALLILSLLYCALHFLILQF